MIFKYLYMYIFGIVDITVEGFFIERFMNICRNENIILWNLKIENGTILRGRISKDDLENINNIAKKTSCRVAINKKSGLPFLVKKYKKRKSFLVAILVIAIFCFGITRFIWNIEIIGNENISKEEILSDLAKYGIKEGKLKMNLNLDEINNEIRLERSDLSWIGIDMEGTSVIVNIVEATKKPEIIDNSEPSNIIADKSGIISKMVVRSGTARVDIGADVSVGDILVEGIMEGQYTDARSVKSDADIYIVSTYEKEKKESFIQKIQERTGNIEKHTEIYINNFKIFFNKGVTKFESCDTIRTYKKLKLFSNYYIPVEIVGITNFELKEEFKTFTEDELKQKIIDELEEEFSNEIDVDNSDNINKDITSTSDSNGVTVNFKYIIEEKIGTEE